MLTLPLGPLALPVKPVLLLVCLLACAAFARYLYQRTGRSTDGLDFSGTITNAAFLGLLVARLGYVADHHEAYLAQPWSMLDVRDGGYVLWLGLITTGIVLWYKARHSKALQIVWASAYFTTGIAGLSALWTLQPAQNDLWIEPLDASTRSQKADLYPALLDPKTGRVLTLRQLASGRPMVINLWASWCAPCRAEMPDLAHVQIQNPQVAFVFVNQGETAQTVQTFLGAQPYTLQNVVMDPNRALGTKAQSTGLPTTLFVDKSGILRDTHFGVLNAAALQARLADLQR